MRRTPCSVLGAVLIVCGIGSACSAPPQEIAVRFRHAPGQTRPDPGEVAALRSACPGTAAVRLKPASTSTLPSVLLVPVRYDVTGASDGDIAAVEACVNTKAGVESVYQQRRTG